MRKSFQKRRRNRRHDGPKRRRPKCRCGRGRKPHQPLVQLRSEQGSLRFQLLRAGVSMLDTDFCPLCGVSWGQSHQRRHEHVFGDYPKCPKVRQWLNGRFRHLHFQRGEQRYRLPQAS